MSGLPIGAARGLAVFMGAMTAFWSVNLLAASVALAIVGMVLGVAVIAASFVVGRGSASPETGTPKVSSERPKGSRTFLVAVILEVVVALVAIVALGASGHGDFIMPVIALVVALHFYVFLLTQRMVVHVIAGTVGTLGSLIAIILMATGIVPATTGRAIAGTALALCTLGYGIVFLRLVNAGAAQSASPPAG